MGIESLLPKNNPVQLDEDGNVVQPGFDESGRFVDQRSVDLSRKLELLTAERETFDETMDNLRGEIETMSGQDLSFTENASGGGLNPLAAKNALAFDEIDPDVDQSGVQDYKLRSGLSAADTPEERANFLADLVGEDGFSFDALNNYTLTPRGQSRLGMEPYGS